MESYGLRDSEAVSFALVEAGVDPKVADATLAIVDRLATALHGSALEFPSTFSPRATERLAQAWGPPLCAQRSDVVTISRRELLEMTPHETHALFAVTERRALQERMRALVGTAAASEIEFDNGERAAISRKLSDLLVFDHLPTGTEVRDCLGQKLMHAIRVSLGDKTPEATLAKVYRNSFARAICRNLKFCLYYYLAHVLIKDDFGASLARPMAESLPEAVPLGYGEFRGRTGIILLVGNAFDLS